MFDFLNNSVMENRTRNKKTVRRLLDKYGTLDNFMQNSTRTEDLEYKLAQGDSIVDEVEQERQAMMKAMNSLPKQHGSSLDDNDMMRNARVQRAKHEMMNSLSQDFLDMSYGVNRAVNGLTAGGLDYLGGKFGFDSRMNNYLNLLSSDERKYREQLGTLTEIGGTALIGDKMIRSVPMIGDEFVRMRGRRELVNQLKRGHDFTDINFGKIEKSKLDALNDIRRYKNVAEIKDRTVTIPSDRVEHLYMERILGDKYTPQDVTNTISNALYGNKSIVYSDKKYDTLQNIINHEILPNPQAVIGKIRNGEGVFLKTGFKNRKGIKRKTNNPSSEPK